MNLTMLNLKSGLAVSCLPGLHWQLALRRWGLLPKITLGNSPWGILANQAHALNRLPKTTFVLPTTITIAKRLALVYKIQVTCKVHISQRGGSRTAATSMMECFEITVKGWKPLTIITKCSILDAAKKNLKNK